jgi:hypothetical protein
MNTTGENGEPDLRQEAPNWRGVVTRVTQTILMVGLGASAFAVVLPWAYQLPLEALASMCGQNVCLPIVLPGDAPSKLSDPNGMRKMAR